MAPILGYHNLRGLCEPIRYLLHYKGVEFEDKRYANMEEWFKEKFNLGLDFPNLPYYIDGDLRLTQSLAIFRHLARKHQLAGSNEKEMAMLEVIEQQLVDLRTKFFHGICVKTDFEKAKEDFIKTWPEQFDKWSAYLGDKKFLAGDHVTYVDFLAYETFDFHEYLAPTFLKGYPTLKEYQKRIRSLPELQPYLTSSAYKRWPLFGPMATFGSKGEEPKKD